MRTYELRIIISTYILGEDPYLGATLIQPVVSGIQGQGVIATMKHYINNNQVSFFITES